MKTQLALLAPLLALAALAPADGAAWSRVGDDRNAPTVQSAFDGAMYVRATPAEDLGDRGTTEVFRVARGGDERVDVYPTYLRGELLLGWSPLAGEYALIQIEPERLTSGSSMRDAGRVARIAFHLGGEPLRAWSGDELRALGLERRVAHIDGRRPGDFTVRGIVQIPATNVYALRLERVDPAGQAHVLDLDITTGEPLLP